MSDPRHTLVTLADARSASLAELSRMLGRNAAYLQQFVARGSPRRLAEDDRRLLAAFLRCDETALGGPPATDATVLVPWLDIAAAAGAGRVADQEQIRRYEPLPAAMLRDAGVAAADTSLIDAVGDSMAPTILNGDRLLVDRAARAIEPRALYVFRRDDALSVKRLSPAGGAITVASDNADYPTLTLPRDEIAIVGRVRLLVRRT